MNESWARVLDHVADSVEGREALRVWARRIVDATWNSCTESEEVPSTKHADEIIDSVWKPPARTGCQHLNTKPYNIGFDDGICCADCGVMQ